MSRRPIPRHSVLPPPGHSTFLLQKNPLAAYSMEHKLWRLEVTGIDQIAADIIQDAQSPTAAAKLKIIQDAYWQWCLTNHQPIQKRGSLASLCRNNSCITAIGKRYSLTLVPLYAIKDP